MADHNLLTGEKEPGGDRETPGTGEPGSSSSYPDLGTADPTVADPAFALDGTDPTVATGDQSGTVPDDTPLGSRMEPLQDDDPEPGEASGA
jgi:hypothetical protein